ncbi:MAG TPA: outer membrane protein assembly factor BamD, partial [Polyangia bacterium]
TAHEPSAHEAHRAARHTDLAAEHALLADARSAMQSSDAARALAILDDHARRFPRGQLAEERDALRVGALWLSGDHAAARRHADEFARRHPGSLFLPSVERAVE